MTYEIKEIIMSAGIPRVHGAATPGWLFGRNLVWIKVKRIDDNNNGLDQAIIDEAVAIVGRHAEVFFIGPPHVSDNWGKFMVLVAAETFNDGDDTIGNIASNANAKTLQYDLANANLGGVGAEIEFWHVYDGDQFGQI